MWVRYHLRLGVDVLRVYDFDGSFAEASAPWVAGGRVIYEPWRDRLDPEVVAACAERGAALCFELQAYSHCLLQARHNFPWAMLLHSPDTFLFSGKGEKIGSLLDRLDAHPRLLPVAILSVL